MQSKISAKTVRDNVNSVKTTDSVSKTQLQEQILHQDSTMQGRPKALGELGGRLGRRAKVGGGGVGAQKGPGRKKINVC